MKRILLFLLAFILYGISGAQNITAMEYFIDGDPGAGFGTLVTGTPLSSGFTHKFDVSMASVTDGFHTLSVRVKDTNDKWSTTFTSPFYKLPASTFAAAPNLTKLEYFIDGDLGVGNAANGTFNITTGTSLSNQDIMIPLTSVSDGFHTLSFRAQDANGKWSTTFTSPFYKIPASATAAVPNLSKLEYFIDNDPGAGNGTAITGFTAGTSLTNYIFDVPVTSQTVATHLISVRAQDANNKWSMVYYANFTMLGPEPTAQPTSLAFSNIQATTMTVSWTAATGSPAGYIVLRKTGSSPTDVPEDGTNYTAGNTIGTSTVAYFGSAVTFNETTLAASTVYYYDIFSYNGTTGLYNYLGTTPLEGSQTTLATQPTAQPTAINFSGITNNSMTVNFTAASGTPAGYIGLRKTGSSPTDIPVDGTGYSADNPIGTSTVAFVGSGTSFTVSGLSASTVYNYDIFSYNGTTSTYNYLTTTPLEGSQTTFAVQPTAQPTSITFTSITDVSMTVGFLAATGSPTGYIGLRKTGSSPTDVPVDGITYSADGPIGSSTVAFFGSGTSFPVSNLSASTVYYYDIFSYNGTTGTYNYLTTTPLEGNKTTLATQPTAQPTTISFSNVLADGMTVSFSAATGSPTGYMGILKTGNFSTDVPVDGTAYSVGGSIGTSTVAFFGNGISFDVSGLSASTIYFFDIFSYNGTTGTYNYLTTAPLEGSQSTLAAEPSAQPTAIQFTSVTTSSFTVGFTAPLNAPTGYLVIRKVGSVPTGVPVDGTTYSTTLGDGDVVSVGPLTSIEQTALSASTQYFYKIYAYNGSGPLINYLTSAPLEGNVTTLAPPVQITLETFPSTYNKGSDLVVSITVNNAANASSVKIKYRGISDKPIDDLQTATLTNTGNKFEKIFTSIDLKDALGMKYYFEVTALDASVITSNTGKSYRRYPAGEDIPNLTFGAQLSKYQIIAVPLTLTSPGVGSVFSSLMPYDNTQWRLFDYFGDDNREYSPSGSGFTTVDPGKGYWFISRNSVTINPGEGTVLLVDEPTPKTIVLKPKWNLIGNPYNFKISWAEALAASGSPANVSTGISLFNNGTLAEGSQLNAYQGGFVENKNATNITITFPVLRNKTINGGRVASEDEIDLSSADWNLPILVSNGELTNARGGIGMHPQAEQNGQDAFDRVSVPLLEGMGMPELDFSGHNSTALFNRDVVPSVENFTWIFKVNHSGDVQLSWPVIDKKSDRQLMLLDVQTQRIVDMTEINSLNISLPGKGLKIFFGNRQYISASLDKEINVVGLPYPNPAREEVNIPIYITESQSNSVVNLRVYNSLGEEVALLANKQLSKGFHTVNWKPTTVSPGLYFVAVQVGNGTEKRVRLIIH